MTEISDRRVGYYSLKTLHIQGHKKYRHYNLEHITVSSGNRLRRLLNSDRVVTTVEFEDDWLTPTVYFQYYVKPVVIRTQVITK